MPISHCSAYVLQIITELAPFLHESGGSMVENPDPYPIKHNPDKGNATLKKPDIILVSTLKRTLQTASIVFDDFRNCPETRWIASDVIREAVQEHPWTSPPERKPCNYREGKIIASRLRELVLLQDHATSDNKVPMESCLEQDSSPSEDE